MKKHIESHFHCGETMLTFDAIAIEPNIPVSKELEEPHQLRNHRIELVGIHLMSDIVDESLQRWQDPPIDNRELTHFFQILA